MTQSNSGVQNQVQVKPAPHHDGWQVGHVPTPDLAHAGGDVCRRWTLGLWRLGATTVCRLIVGAQHSAESGLAGQVHALSSFTRSSWLKAWLGVGSPLGQLGGVQALLAASSRQCCSVPVPTPTSLATNSSAALSGGNNRATARFLNVCPYRANFFPSSPPPGSWFYRGDNYCDAGGGACRLANLVNKSAFP